MKYFNMVNSNAISFLKKVNVLIKNEKIKYSLFCS